MPTIDNNHIDNFREDILDLCPYYCGYEDCEPGHFYGPAVRDHYLIHYVIEGKGCFEVEGRVYHLEKGQGFLICPGIITFYKADDNCPWIYTWVGFHGLHADTYLKRANLSLDNPIFTCANHDSLCETFRSMLETRHLKNTKDTRLTSLLYLLVSQLIENSASIAKDTLFRNRDAYIRKALVFVSMNYSRQMTIEEMAHHVSIDRKYLSLIFKESLNLSPKQYLTLFRINQACNLMENTNLSLSEISWSVGYTDALLFSKIFRRVRGMSPREYRKRHLNTKRYSPGIMNSPI